VTREVKAYALMKGVPAKQAGWMSEHGDKIPLPTVGDGEFICKKTQTLYRLKANSLRATKSSG